MPTFSSWANFGTRKQLYGVLSFSGKVIVLSVFATFVLIDWTDYFKNGTANFAVQCKNYNPVLCTVDVIDTQFMSTTAFFSLGITTYFMNQHLALYRAASMLSGTCEPGKGRRTVTSCLSVVHTTAVLLLVAYAVTFLAPILIASRNPTMETYGYFRVSNVTLELFMAGLTIGSAAILYASCVVATILMHSYRLAVRQLTHKLTITRTRLTVITEGQLLETLRQYHSDEMNLISLHREIEGCLGLTVLTNVVAAVFTVAQTAAATMQADATGSDPAATMGFVLKNTFFIWIIVVLVVFAERASKEGSRTEEAWLRLRACYWDQQAANSHSSSETARLHTAAVEAQPNNDSGSIKFHMLLDAAVGYSVQQRRTFHACGILSVSRQAFATVAMLSVTALVFLWDRKEGYTGNVNKTVINNTTLLAAPIS